MMTEPAAYQTDQQVPHPHTACQPGTAHHSDVLRDLIDLGHAIARTVHAQAMRDEAQALRDEAQRDDTASAAPRAILDHVARFDRIARCIRRTILLAEHLVRPPDTRRTVVRKQVLRRCEDHIAGAAFNNRRGRTPELDTGTLHTELLERIDSPDLEDDIQNRPLEDIVNEICRDLGLGLQDLPGLCPAPRRTPADLATLAARAASPPRSNPVTFPRSIPGSTPRSAPVRDG